MKTTVDVLYPLILMTNIDYGERIFVHFITSNHQISDRKDIIGDL
jgi:hypothetical protein